MVTLASAASTPAHPTTTSDRSPSSDPRRTRCLYCAASHTPTPRTRNSSASPTPHPGLDDAGRRIQRRPHRRHQRMHTAAGLGLRRRGGRVPLRRRGRDLDPPDRLRARRRRQQRRRRLPDPLPRRRSRPRSTIRQRRRPRTRARATSRNTAAAEDDAAAVAGVDVTDSTTTVAATPTTKEATTAGTRPNATAQRRTGSDVRARRRAADMGEPHSPKFVAVRNHRAARRHDDTSGDAHAARCSTRNLLRGRRKSRRC